MPLAPLSNPRLRHRAKGGSPFQGSRTGLPTALRMSYFGGPEWDAPPYEMGPVGPVMPPPGYGRGMGVVQGTGGPYGANQSSPNYYRRGGGRGFRRGAVPGRPGSGVGGAGGSAMGGDGMGGVSMGGGGMGDNMGGVSMGGNMGPFDPFVGGPMGQGGPFGRDNAVGRTSLRDMAARSTTSFDAEVINRMNGSARLGSQNAGGASGGDSGSASGAGRGDRTRGQQQRQQQRRPQPAASSFGAASSPGPFPGRGGPASINSQYVPLSSTYGPPATRGPPVPTMPGMGRSPPLSVAPPPPPQAYADEGVASATGRTGGATSASSGTTVPPTVRTARTVRPSVVLVTSEGVRKENSQGSGFVVAFDDGGVDEEEDDDDDDDGFEKDRVHVLTSAHVAPPGWKVSVTFPDDPNKQYPATVVGRKLNSDLALLRVEAVVEDEDDDYPFPPPLVLSADEVPTGTASALDAASAEIGSPVHAFGYPMGVEGPTMTSGILSATTRGINYMDAPTGEDAGEVSKSRPFERTSFVITDAAMAGGMSGGPLVDGDGVVLGINALVRPDLRALGNYAVSARECETFLEKLEDRRRGSKGGGARSSAGRSARTTTASATVEAVDDSTSPRRSAASNADGSDSSAEDAADDGVAGYRVMLYGYSTDKAEATRTLRRVAGLDEPRAENAMRSAYSFGAGVVDEFYVAEGGNRGRAVKAAKKSADELEEKLKEEGMMVEVEPLNLLK
ncbi:hypothetical protein ACHAWF_015047 [Thalassiosira exigua]